MNNKNMKKRMSQFIFLTLSITFLATMAFAYREPTDSQPTGASTGGFPYGPVTESATAQVKTGDLSVYAFTVANTTTLKDQTIFTGPVSAATTSPSTLRFGDATHPVAVSVNRNVQADSMQSDTIKSGGVGVKKPLCADAVGKIFLCN